MKIILLQNLSGAKSYDIGEELDVNIRVAQRYIKKNIAKPKNIKEYNKLEARLEKTKREEEEAKARAIAVLKQKELKESALSLKAELDSILELIGDKEFAKKVLTK